MRYVPMMLLMGALVLGLGGQPAFAQGQSPPVPAQQQYYAVLGGQQSGPMTRTELEQAIKAGRIDGNTLLWKSGMADWVPAKDVPDVADLLGPAPFDCEQYLAGNWEMLMHEKIFHLSFKPDKTFNYTAKNAITSETARSGSGKWQAREEDPGQPPPEGLEGKTVCRMTATRDSGGEDRFFFAILDQDTMYDLSEEYLYRRIK